MKARIIAHQNQEYNGRVVEIVDHEAIDITAENIVLRRVESPIFEIDGLLVPGWTCMWTPLTEDIPLEKRDVPHCLTCGQPLQIPSSEDGAVG